MLKLIGFLLFLAGVCMVLWGSLLPATIKGIIAMVSGTAILVVSLFLYNRRG